MSFQPATQPDVDLYEDFGSTHHCLACALGFTHQVHILTAALTRPAACAFDSIELRSCGAFRRLGGLGLRGAPSIYTATT